MLNSRGVRSFSIHFDGEDADAHVLPAPVLIESIAQIQRIVFLLAKMHRREPLRQRASFSRTLRDDFALLCHLPEAGSYAFPVEIGQQSANVAPADLIGVCELFRRVTGAVRRRGRVPTPRDRHGHPVPELPGRRLSKGPAFAPIRRVPFDQRPPTPQNS